MQNQGGGSNNSSGNFQKIGEGLGGLMGQAADQAAGMFGTMMNGMGGWWSQAANQQGSSSSFGKEHDSACRNHFEASVKTGSGSGGLSGSIKAEGSGSPTSSSSTSSGSTSSGSGAAGTTGGASFSAGGGGASGSARMKSYDSVRPLYQLGHLAGQNPDYQGRSFEEIEPELQRGWGQEQTQRHGAWPEVRGYVDFGYRQRSGGSGNTGP